ncbi:3-oxo-tetronate kinase [Azohydromonas caseinilytica]|uniref:3-oxo-tetronate kinase n=1 Tax=Azohydromonas caseinilytica TaxID=2728836 RepID=A0A848FCT7_9BURK|nr:3-oxo-tetronate kinase [Azohydromonas caseinilytica]NML17148.1 four-carbon acid sugar kinase family protein [Azohydromonas caseinilytica]
MSMLLGCIADDFTGATDLANNLARAGMRVVQTIGLPGQDTAVDADAVVVALKSRTVEPDAAVAQSLAALRWLRARGAGQIYFKVCSTFDSTERGNIGPVAEALADALGADIVPVCPAFPENQRTVFQGHLFVGDLLLSDSSMRHHPLTPMTDASLVRVLQRQCRGRVGLVDHAVVRRGAEAVRARMQALRDEGVRFGVVDAVANDDLMTMGRAFARLPLLVAGSGVAIGLPQNHGLVPSTAATELPRVPGARAIVSGSCSAASNAQVVDFIQRGGQAFAVDPLRIAAGEDVAGAVLAWAEGRLSAQPLLFYATAEPEAVRSVQARLGVEAAGTLVEGTLSAIARGLVERGVRQLVVAGGETSGACVQALQVARMRVGPQIDPGVPWCHAPSPAAGAQGLLLALKSGNFGTVDFFTKAFGLLA